VSDFRGFGYAVLDGGSATRLDELLRAVADAGYSHAEVDPRRWDVWLGGRVNAGELGRWSRILDRHRDRLAFTLHGPLEANLFETADGRAHAALLQAAVEVAGAIAAEVTVVHPGRRTAGSSAPLAALMAAEREVLAALGARAEEWDGRVAVETWYSAGAVEYSYAVWPEQLVAQIEAVGHPSVGACLDFSHVFLAAEWFGFDFLDGVRLLAPLAVHLHVQDTFGWAHDLDVPALGLGDLHLPPGWGRVPLEEAFRSGDFALRPVVMVELLDERFLPQLENVLVDAQALARRTG
jgi:sugar phosphate isomerase/epimerase